MIAAHFAALLVRSPWCWAPTRPSIRRRICRLIGAGRISACRRPAPDRSARHRGRRCKPGRALIFECVGVPGVIQATSPMPRRPILQIIVVGVCMETDRFEPMLGIVKQLNVQFVLAYTAEEFAASLHHIAEGMIDATPLITGQVGLNGVKDAFAALANPEHHAKVLVDPWQ